MLDNSVKHVVILGGGSAGWLTAGIIAAEHCANRPNGVRVTVIESPDLPPIGVGEGTWPSMRLTLSKIGITETDLFRYCEASFKQGIKFSKWVNGREDDHYYHPLVLPQGFNDVDLVLPWQRIRSEISFADATCYQGYICEKGLAPKQITTPEYASVANYAYHFNAMKLGQFLRQHCIEKLGVTHVVDHVVGVKAMDSGDIASLTTQNSGELAGDLFVDCSGVASILLGKHFNVPFICKKHILFNDTALAVQAPYAEDKSPIPPYTTATAQSNGWIWDIGLPSRRGVGHVYASDYTSEDQAARELTAYLALSLGHERASALSFRKIAYNPGHRAKFWQNNCVAVGLSGGFIEPLEATALVLVESAALMISNELPRSRDVMDLVAKRFNQRFCYYWDTLIDFVKLQYALTQRTDTQYWIDNTKPESIPERLADYLRLWQRQPPNKYDFPLAEEMLPAASWQYILYGMGFVTEPSATEKRSSNDECFRKYMNEARTLAQRYEKSLPAHRELIEKIIHYGLHKL